MVLLKALQAAADRTFLTATLLAWQSAMSSVGLKNRLRAYAQHGGYRAFVQHNYAGHQNGAKVRTAGVIVLHCSSDAAAQRAR